MSLEIGTSPVPLADKIQEEAQNIAFSFKNLVSAFGSILFVTPLAIVASVALAALSLLVKALVFFIPTNLSERFVDSFAARELDRMLISIDTIVLMGLTASVYSAFIAASAASCLLNVNAEAGILDRAKQKMTDPKEPSSLTKRLELATGFISVAHINGYSEFLTNPVYITAIPAMNFLSKI